MLRHIIRCQDCAVKTTVQVHADDFQRFLEGASPETVFPYLTRPQVILFAFKRCMKCLVADDTKPVDRLADSLRELKGVLKPEAVDKLAIQVAAYLAGQRIEGFDAGAWTLRALA